MSESIIPIEFLSEHEKDLLNKTRSIISNQEKTKKDVTYYELVLDVLKIVATERRDWELKVKRLTINAKRDVGSVRDKLENFLGKRKRLVRPYSGFRISDGSEFKFLPDEKHSVK